MTAVQRAKLGVGVSIEKIATRIEEFDPETENVQEIIGFGACPEFCVNGV